MATSVACRVCLATKTPLRIISDTPLQLVYETLTDSHLIQANKPSKLCYVCHSRLQQVYNFTAKAVKANFVLDQMIRTGAMVSQLRLSLLNRKLYDIVPLTFTNTQTITLDPEYSEYPDPSNNPVIAVGDPDVAVDPIKMEVPIEIDDSQDLIEQECDPLANVRLTTVITIKEESLIEEFSKEELSKEELSKEEFSKAELSKEEFSKEEFSKAELSKEEFSKEESPMEVEILTEEERQTPVTVKRTLKRKEKKKFKLNPNHNPKLVQINEITREIRIPLKQQIKEFEERAMSSNYLKSRYKCDICYSGFTNTKTLENHLLRHDKASGRYECDICHVRYRRAGLLRTHKRNTHQRLLECFKCKHTSRTDGQAREHEKWHSGFTYNCTLCGLKFSKLTTYMTHKRFNHYDKECLCTWCGECFVSNNGLRMHKNKTHQGKEPRKMLLDPDPNSDRFCKECNAQFATKEAFHKHMLTALVHNMDQQKMSLQCQICSRTLQSTRAMEYHLQLHERQKEAIRGSPKKYICNDCGKCFLKRGTIRQHIVRVHMNAGVNYHKIVVCEICGLQCNSTACLVAHQYLHTGERPYKCDTCGKGFRDPHNLKLHTRTHTGERPYACAECDLRFKTLTGLTRHQRVHTGERPYSCSVCDKRFSQSNSRKVHILTVHHKVQLRRRRRTNQKRQQQDNGTDGKPT